MSIYKSNWISVDDRLPWENIDCLCLTPSGIYMILNYNTIHKLFNVYGDAIEHAIPVQYWMPLPVPPNLEKTKTNRYKRLAEEHRCVQCTKPLPEGYKLKRCQECNIKMRESASRYKKRYQADGKCRLCFCDLPPNDTHKICKSCRMKQSKYYYAKKEIKTI